ncbi:DUF4959 domain-containing protein [Niabella sp. CC-SYL272]|uniref:DUF5000 domain-containing lipoprotein n=1 Tax=Niabella agricola TaxID=2891571 RepID=UPI001F1CB3BC|nr:DUF5000 domain-containing lipoprotein [Niabella agricola]MCF3108675.1 DUF4959 domain-containing protein [Niabella agricola]
MKLKIIFGGLFAASIALQGCSREEVHTPIFEDAGVPDKIENPVVQNMPGGAKITYELPKGGTPLYVAAEVMNKNGQKRVVKSSFYSNSLVIEGLADTSGYQVSLRSVSKSEKKSDPVLVTIHPQTPPYLEAFKTLQLSPDFGGIYIGLNNAVNTDLMIGLCGTDSLGEFGLLNSYYSNEKTVSYTFRGLPARESRYGVYVQDKWGNRSDTLYGMLAPLFEKMLDKSLFREVRLPGDAVVSNYPNIGIRFAWDGSWSSDYDDPYGNYLNVETDVAKDGRPAWITFDLGTVTHLSRFRLNKYYTYWYKDMHKYEIWGATDPNPDGSWDGWTPLISCEDIKPSGLAYPAATSADKQAWVLGNQANFPSGLPAVRYIRIKCTENWAGNGGNLSFSEITFWGSDR